MNDKKTNKILSIIVVCFLVAYFLVLEYEKERRVEKLIIKFQVDYKDYLDDEYANQQKLLGEIGVFDIFKQGQLFLLFDELKKNAYSNVEKDYLNELKTFDFNSKQNTERYSKEESEKYLELVLESNSLFESYEKSRELSDLYKIKENNNAMVEISSLNLLKNDRNIIDEYTNAKYNRNTDTKSCSEGNAWTYNKALSLELCKKSGLNGCGNPQYNITNNNPKSLKDNVVAYDYVSFLKDDYHYFEFGKIKYKAEQAKNVYTEVYTKEVAGNIIYKYNIVALKDKPVSSCSIG